VQFDTTINEWHTCPKDGPIRASNPCSEYMFLDDTAMLIIVAPLYVPLIIALGFNPIWYGVLYTITCQIAYLTPPFGYNLFLMRAFAPPEISMGDIYKSVTPFVLVMIATLALIMAVPDLALWLPNTIYPD
jgi:TRAP-type C4-dicarboxylate transport system permease large subunit